MNKTAIQRFAIWARTELIAQVSQRAYQYDITADGYGDDDAEAVGGRLLSDEEKQQRRQLIDQIRSKGYAQVMEEIAYTWFNRLIALRFMEVNNYLPSHIRVFSDASGAFKPEILSDALHLDLDGLDMKKVSDLIEKNQSEALYRYLLLTQCNALSGALPRMFEPMGSYTELLLPNNILRQDGVLGRMVTDIPEEDWTDQVQIIGWLYQYYNTELKDETFALLKKNVKITKERIPSATQLFTPDWIVRYMVENSLGRLWLEGHPDDELKAGWKYYLEEAGQEPDVQAQLEAIRAEYRALRPQDIKVIDPCMGSGHILVYAFDVLVQIYKKAGFSERDAAQSILENNLYGLDIDDRAAQLAYFAVMMKARQYDRRIFTRNIQPHVYAIVESNEIRIPAKWNLGPEQGIAEKLVAELKDAKVYGSILKLSITIDELGALRNRLGEIKKRSTKGNLLDMMESLEIVDRLLPLVEIADILIRKFDVVVTNPPYMGNSSMLGKLSNYLKDNYLDGKSDLFAAFIIRCCAYTCKNGLLAMITQHGWMFLSSYGKLRNNLLNKTDIINMAHLGARAFDEISGEVVQTTSFILRQKVNDKYVGIFRKLVSQMTELSKKNAFLSGDKKGTFMFSAYIAKRIPNHLIAYWLSNKMIYHLVSTKKVEQYGITKQGLITSDNERFLRFWYEVNPIKIGSKWFLYNKGGGFRRWYGNIVYVVNWENDGYEICNFCDDTGKLRSRPQNIQFFFRKGLTWNDVSTAKFCCRFVDDSNAFDASGPMLFLDDENLLYYFLGLLNSTVTQEFMDLICQGLHYSTGHIPQIPVVISNRAEVEKLVKACK